MTDDRISVLVERLAMACVDVEVERCDPVAMRETARDLLELADLLDPGEVE
jgi:hypothetical protein